MTTEDIILSVDYCHSLYKVKVVFVYTYTNHNKNNVVMKYTTKRGQSLICYEDVQYTESLQSCGFEILWTYRKATE